MFASGIFAGASVYINFVEHPARLSCGVQLAVTEWRPSYKRGTLMQAPLVAVGSLSSSYRGGLIGVCLGSSVDCFSHSLFRLRSS